MRRRLDRMSVENGAAPVGVNRQTLIPTEHGPDVVELFAADYRVEQKRMFGGTVFMVRDKMCVGVGKRRIMCRIDPTIHDAVVERKGCRTVVMRGRPYNGKMHR